MGVQTHYICATHSRFVALSYTLSRVCAAFGRTFSLLHANNKTTASCLPSLTCGIHFEVISSSYIKNRGCVGYLRSGTLGGTCLSMMDFVLSPHTSMVLAPIIDFAFQPTLRPNRRSQPQLRTTDLVAVHGMLDFPASSGNRGTLIGFPLVESQTSHAENIHQLQSSRPGTSGNRPTMLVFGDLMTPCLCEFDFDLISSLGKSLCLCLPSSATSLQEHVYQRFSNIYVPLSSLYTEGEK